MSVPDFVDYYEILHLSPAATFDAIECMFRHQAKRYHPDAGATGCQEKFKRLVHAYNSLKDPEKRAAYDLTYERNRRDQKSLISGAESTADDYEVRHRMLSLFYAQRRRNMKQPGLGTVTVEELMKMPPELVDFHLWYFREKGWIQREPSGPFAITQTGVDEIESREAKRAEQLNERITFTPSVTRIQTDAPQNPALSKSSPMRGSIGTM